MRSLLIDDLHRAFADGLEPAALIDEIYDAIAALADPGIFIHIVDRDTVTASASALGPFDPVSKPLWGIPFAVKDNIDVAGLPTTAACPAFAYRAEQSATVVERLLAAGALLIGKTNLDQFATGLVGVRSPYPVPRNALDPSLVPGGSSSGSAVAVARGLVSFALGTDTAGSGRVPAALDDIVGLKPTVGLVSTRGVVPACRTLDCVSIFASSVDDAARTLDIAASYDAADPYSRVVPSTRVASPPRLRIGVPTDTSLEFCGDTLAASAFDAHLRDLTSIGADIVRFDLTPFRDVANLLYDGPWVAERYQAIRRFIERDPTALHPVTHRIIAGATRLSAADAFAGLYRLKELQRTTSAIWADVDVIAVPSIPTVVTRADLEKDPIGPNAMLGTYTNFVNLLDLCALAVPGRFRADRRPAGLTLIAEAGADRMLAAIGRRLHEAAQVNLGATTHTLPSRAAAPTNKLPAGWIEIVAVGAHMSGLPLNHELTAKGGCLLRTAHTTGSYALHALPGGPPARPGLIRVAEGRGTAIEVEVWGMPPAAFGAFVAGIPPPLGIGTVRLADGTTPKGFLVEPEGIVGAEDISHFGGWRAYLARSR